VRNILELLHEAWHGGPLAGRPEGWSYYSWAGAGLEQTLGALSAARAGTLTGGTSIAQHTKHVAVGARIFAGWLGGPEVAPDWAGSWVVGELDEAGWAALKTELWDSLEVLRATIAAHALSEPERLDTSLGAVSHIVYHHGAIRQKALLVQ
jgi:hypothetical protein